MICWASWPLTMSRKKRSIIRHALQIICWSGKKNIVLIITLQLKMSRAWYCIKKILRHFAPWPFWEQESAYSVFLVRQILFLASRGFIDKVLYCQITDKASKSLRDTIVIESQKGQGQSNIVFSSSISVADAIRAANELKADLKFSEVETFFVDVPDM